MELDLNTDTRNFLLSTLASLDDQGSMPNYELSGDDRPTELRANITNITEYGYVFVNFSEPILLPPNSPEFLPDDDISAYFLSVYDKKTEKYDINPDFIPKKLGRRLNSMMT